MHFHPHIHGTTNLCGMPFLAKAKFARKLGEFVLSTGFLFCFENPVFAVSGLETPIEKTCFFLHKKPPQNIRRVIGCWNGWTEPWLFYKTLLQF